MINKTRLFIELKKKLFTRKFEGNRGSKQIEGIDLIIDTWEREYSHLSMKDVAYMLATVYHETAYTMQPIREGGGQKYLRSKRYYPWFGRGYVQLTWERNYKFAKEKLDVDFTGNPDLALEPEHAVDILFVGMIEGWFTGKSLSSYITERDLGYKKNLTEFANARRIINGTDKQIKIAKEAAQFYDALKKSEVKNDKPLSASRTMKGATAGAVGGASLLVEPVEEVVTAVQDAEAAISTGSIISIAIACVVIAGALYAAYARWDDAGRPDLI